MRYLIREVGWVFNDSTYENDGNYRTVEIFDSKNVAIKRKREIELEYFLERFDFMHRYEAYADYKKDFRAYKSKVTEYLVEEFKFNPTIRLNGHYGYSTSMFLRELSPDDVQKLLEVMNIEFFTIVEIEDSRHIQFEAKINAFYNDGREEYLWDYQGINKLRFDSRLEAFKRFIDEDYHFRRFTFKKTAKLIGTLNEISDVSDLLQSYIQTTREIEYRDQQLILSPEISAKTILRLNELLKEPILIFEEVEIQESKDQFDKNLLSTKNRNKSEKNTLYEESYKALENDEYHLSKAYLNHYSFRLSMDDRFFNYRNIIEAYLSEQAGIQLEEKHGSYYYQNVHVQLYGVIKSMREITNNFILEGCFGFGQNRIFDIWKTAFGCHEDMEKAFDNSLENWLDLYGHDYIDYLINRSTIENT